MQKQTKFVPAGIQLGKVNFKREKLSGLVTETDQLNKSLRKSIPPENVLPDTSLGTVKHKQHNSVSQSANINSCQDLPINNQNMSNETNKRVEMEPPKIICPSKSIKYIKLPVYNENSGLWADIKDLDVVKDFLAVEAGLNSVTVPTENSSQKTGSSSFPTGNIAMLKCIKRREELKNKLINKTKETTFNSEVNPQQLSQKIGDQNCDCKNCDNYINCPTWCSNNITFDKSDICIKVQPLLRTSYETKQEISYIACNNIVLHGPVILKPISSADKTQLDESVQRALKEKLNSADAKDVHSYMWPAVQRGLDIFIIGPSKSGKTLSYLPAFCSFAMEKRYLELDKHQGPCIVILCFNQKKCEELQNLIKILISDSAEAVTVEVLAEDSMWQSNGDILITTPSTLEEGLKAGRVQLKCLRHLAIESAHLVLRKYNENMQKLFKLLNEIQTKRSHKNIQISLTSEKWSVDLETLLKSLYITPLVCFDDFLEAAIYSNIQMTKKSLKNTHKIYYLIDILKSNFKTHRTVVFCNETEISRLKERLQLQGIEFIAISKNLIEDDLFANEDIWCSLDNGDYKVLLCTDQVFEKTKNILVAHWIVHYDLPSKWKQFTRRFRCLASNLTSPLPSSEDAVSGTSKRSFLIIDDLCESQPFLDFLTLLAIKSTKNFQL